MERMTPAGSVIVYFFFFLTLVFIVKNLLEEWEDK